MKTFLKPEDKQEHLRMVKSLDMALALWDIDQWLRSKIKYADMDYQDIRDELHKTMERYGIDLYELIT